MMDFRVFFEDSFKICSMSSVLRASRNSVVFSWIFCFSSSSVGLFRIFSMNVLCGGVVVVFSVGLFRQPLYFRRHRVSRRVRIRILGICFFIFSFV